MSAAPSWPNLFVVGAARAGTTSLLRYLGEHPDVFMTRFKEPHFFSRHRPSLAPYVHDEAAYLRLFASARTPFRGEASTSYLWAEPAAARIERASPEAKILISVRDPVERSHSFYWHRVRRGLERRSFAAAVADELERGFPHERPSCGWHIRCAADLRRYLDVFGTNVRVIVFEELIRDVARELAGVFDFLGVDPTVSRQIEPERHNAFAVPRSRLAADLLGSDRTRRVARALVPYRARWSFERTLIARRRKPSMDAETDRILTEYFASEVRELQGVLGRPLPWSRWPALAATA
ncbi:MAG: sulfotransferase [Actinomycetota bacterium]|nr:sulfotransferase [Actinomycetota bacterium]